MALYYELPVYRDVYKLILMIFECTKDFSKEYKYTLGQDMKRDALQLVRNIYRANKSVNKKEYLEAFLDDFELLKLEIRLCSDMKILPIKKQAALAMKRSIKVGAVLKSLLLEYYELLLQPNLDCTIFNYSLRHTNRLLQFGSRFVGIRKKRVSTHSLRKSGARFLYDENHRSEDVFLKISMILNHSSTQVSRRYLGITKEEISDVYDGFDIFL